jgi:serine protease Do
MESLRVLMNNLRRENRRNIPRKDAGSLGDNCGKAFQGRAALRKAALIVAALLVSSGVGLPHAAASGGAGLDARIIDGEVYVRASSLLNELGGTGTYDPQTRKYVYTPASIPEVIRKVSPSVVAIIGKPDDQYADHRFSLSHGTGVIVKQDGWIVTNAHVVKDMRQLVVVTHDGSQYDAVIKMMDETSDLALVKIEAEGLAAAAFAPAPLDLQVGETVIAIGTPVSFSLRNTATVGVLSGLNRSVSSYYNLLQTDAAINPGNSGGPLANMKGEIIGINTMKFVDVDIDSMGFAIPADTVRYILDQFEQYGKVNRPSLGLELEESWSAVVGLPTDEPLRIMALSSPEAEEAGIREGDLLYSIDGRQVSTVVEIHEILKSYLPGQTVNLTLLNTEGDLISVPLVLAESTAP